MSTLFGAAECACNTSDVNLEIKLVTPLPAGLSGTAEVWVGDSSCTNATTRTSASNMTCEKIATLPIQDFTINSNAPFSGIEVPLPARSLFSPLRHDCSFQPLAANGVYVFIYADVDNPYATCALSLTESSAPPPAPVDVSATRQDDGSVVVRWTAPPERFVHPVAYDVLCATDDGAPVAGSAAIADFSQCTSDGIVRRALHYSDGRVVPGGSAPSSGDAISTPRADAVCAHVDSDGRAATIAGLAWNTRYRFAVVAADASGNGAVSAPVTLDASTPPPPAPPAPTHRGCSVGGRGSVTPSALILLAAALSCLMLTLRHRPRRA
ncbi:MAG: fibronectin type III domain-containing protein [Polyangia bacterium]